MFAFLVLNTKIHVRALLIFLSCIHKGDFDGIRALSSQSGKNSTRPVLCNYIIRLRIAFYKHKWKTLAL